jgi:tRNA A37 threonylcarbamoyladenosine synthetase subunit TsaC/SUA5/YrdC
MGTPNIEADAQRVFEILKSGGVAICPADVGYAIMTCNPKALEKVFTTKKRGSKLGQITHGPSCAVQSL